MHLLGDSDLCGTCNTNSATTRSSRSTSRARPSSRAPWACLLAPLLVLQVVNHFLGVDRVLLDRVQQRPRHGPAGRLDHVGCDFSERVGVAAAVGSAEKDEPVDAFSDRPVRSRAGFGRYEGLRRVRTQGAMTCQYGSPLRKTTNLLNHQPS